MLCWNLTLIELRRNEKNWHWFVSFKEILRIKVFRPCHNANMSIFFVSRPCFLPKMLLLQLYPCLAPQQYLPCNCKKNIAPKMPRWISGSLYIFFIEFSKLLTSLFPYVCSLGKRSHLASEVKWRYNLYNRYCFNSNYVSQPLAVLQPLSSTALHPLLSPVIIWKSSRHTCPKLNYW